MNSFKNQKNPHKIKRIFTNLYFFSELDNKMNKYINKLKAQYAITGNFIMKNEDYYNLKIKLNELYNIVLK